jgi:hypothetical protein
MLPLQATLLMSAATIKQAALNLARCDQELADHFNW